MNAHHLNKPSPRHAHHNPLHRPRLAQTVSPARKLHQHTSDVVNVEDLAEGDTVLQDDPLHQMLHERWLQSEARIDSLFASTADQVDVKPRYSANAPTLVEPAVRVSTPTKSAKPARAIDDDYGDDEDDEHDQDQSPLGDKQKSLQVNGHVAALARSPSLSQNNQPGTRADSASQSSKSIDDVRKQLEQHKSAAQDVAKRTFHTMFYTFESDRHAMLEQHKLDELDRQMDHEMTMQNGDKSAGANGPAQGSLSSADLGASSLTLKHLIARIDAQRNLVRANDTQLRSLISEVRKGRSKWASEDKVGQEELYEAAEKVLMELKAMTEYSAPFLQRVNKRDAPDYYNVIKHPMDIGTMIKKLKGLQYKSKKEFVADLNYIWSNCLSYNAEPSHPIRKKALYMRKETDKLVPLIPDVIVRDRAEVEAEEERNQALENGLDGGEDSEDDLPIMASRGRKAPTKAKKNAKPSKTTNDDQSNEDSADPAKPTINTSTTNLKSEIFRADSDNGDSASHAFGTPPPGSATPQNNALSQLGQGDVLDNDLSSVVNAVHDDVDDNDAEFITWRQVTKKDRATAAADRNRLFHNDRLNPDEPALLRSKAGMRKWIRQQKQYFDDTDAADHAHAKASVSPAEVPTGGETLAQGIEGDQDRTLPDYYETLTAIPELDNTLAWKEDEHGHVHPHNEQYISVYPARQFTAPQSVLSNRIDSNMRQMQDTRKVCAKIGIVKQMQIQAQTYQNQFQKYEPEPFLEQDINALATTEPGPIMSPWLCRTTLERSVGKIFYHAGFEDFQPSALSAITDVATDYFKKLVTTLALYQQTPKTETGMRFTTEEQILHSLHDNGIDLDSLETYVMEDVERLGTKLVGVHDRLRSHLADLLRPALGEHVGADGVGAFHDGSQQFVGGDFAEDIDEDFFGFRELGLADELGLASLSVPLHLLQNRVHNAYSGGSQTAIVISGLAFEPPAPYEVLSTENLQFQLGIVQEFFASKLAANHGRSLVEDQDLPPKQRFPKPRLGPAGKISSPRKRPIREQQQMAKKRRKLEESGLAQGSQTQFVGVENERHSAGTGLGPQSGHAEKVNGINGTFQVKPVRPMPSLTLNMPDLGVASVNATVNGQVNQAGQPGQEGKGTTQQSEMRKHSLANAVMVNGHAEPMKKARDANVDAERAATERTSSVGSDAGIGAGLDGLDSDKANLKRGGGAMISPESITAH